MERGADWFKSMGVPADPDNPRDVGSYGPKLYCLSGHIEKPGCYEAPLGITVNELIDEHGGGVWKGRRGKAAIPGGISMGLLTADEFDCPLDFAGPGKYKCLGLGTAAVVVMDETVSMVEFLHNSAQFFAHESCGQCTPCREGTSWALKILKRIRAGKGRLIDLELLLEIGDNIGIMPGTTICGLADGAAWPLKNAIRKFRDEFEEHIRTTNPAGFENTDPGARHGPARHRLPPLTAPANNGPQRLPAQSQAQSPRQHHGHRHHRRTRDRNRRRRAPQRH